MPKNNVGIFRDFNINNFTNKFESIKKGILLENNLTINIDEKDIKIFIFMIKSLGIEIIYNINYVSKEKLIYIINKKLTKKFFINNISLLFIFLYCENKIDKITKEEEVIKYERDIKNLYRKIFNIIDNFYLSNVNNSCMNDNSLLEISDIFELI